MCCSLGRGHGPCRPPPFGSAPCRRHPNIFNLEGWGQVGLCNDNHCNRTFSISRAGVKSGYVTTTIAIDASSPSLSGAEVESIRGSATITVRNLDSLASDAEAGPTYGLVTSSAIGSIASPRIKPPPPPPILHRKELLMVVGSLMARLSDSQPHPQRGYRVIRSRHLQ